jgi:hypothetical protein
MKETHHYVDEGSTHFINVELDLWSRWPLDAFAEALPRRVSRHYVGCEGRIYGAHFGPGFPRTADSGIRMFLRVLRSLPRSAMKEWKRAHRREFNIGIQGGLRPHAPEFRVGADTLAAVSALNASLVVTVYAAERPSETRPGDPKQPQTKRRLSGAAGRQDRLG